MKHVRWDRRTPEIYTMNAADDTAIDAKPLFSPDGSRIAFRSNRAANRVEQVFTMAAADGSGIMQLTDGPSTKLLNDWGPRSTAPLDPPLPGTEPPPATTNPPPPAGGCPAGTSAGVRCRASSGGGLVITGTAKNDRIVGSAGDDMGALRRRQRQGRRRHRQRPPER